MRNIISFKKNIDILESFITDKEWLTIFKIEFLNNQKIEKDIIKYIKNINGVRIDKINFEGFIYEGTSLKTLAKGVGHFENTPYLTGNVCLAAHNTNSYWSKLHTLSKGDKIQYTCFLGTKEYKVNSITKINETDWSPLENTTDNTLTLITCVKGQKELRLCVQAKEIK